MYKSLSKEEKKNVREEYIRTKRGKDLSERLNRLVLEGSFLILCFVVITTCIFIFDLAWWYWCVAVMCIICAPVLLIGQHNIRIGEYNKFILVNNKLKTAAKRKTTKKSK